MNFKSYLEKKFPDLWNDIHVRFELGDDHPNGSELRLNQVYERVKNIFNHILKEEDEIYLLVKCWEGEDPMFGNTTPAYLFGLLGNGDYKISRANYKNSIGENLSYNELILFTKLSDLKVDLILEGIANYEQGREPSIGQSVYFINMQKDILFHMYDDRGCIICSDNPEKIRVLYNDFNSWIVDYHRKTIDMIFC